MRGLLRSHTILYVEDERPIRENMCEYLGNFFAKVYAAADGEEGLAIYRKHKPDVLILDIDLPKCDGLSVAEQIRKENREVIIVMLTAFTDKEKLLHATELRLLKYLVKPIDLLAFQETLDLIACELMTGSKHFVPLAEGCFWDSRSQKLFFEGQEVVLSDKERRLMRLFVEYRNRSLMFTDIMVHLWEDAHEREISVNSVKNIVSALRKKIPVVNIKNIYGKGYILH